MAAKNQASKIFSLSGRVALVTGSTVGLGRAIAETFLSAGATVIINGRNKERTAKAASDIRQELQTEKACPIEGDCSITKEAEMVVSRVIEQFGHLDILVNNAGVNIPEAPFEEQGVGVDGWKKMMETNLYGVIHLTSLAVPHLKKSSSGRIINISSIGGHVGLPNNSLYTMTKGGILVWTKSLAAELGPSKVTVNSLSPGIFSTRMNTKFIEDEEAHSKAVKLIPMARLGNPEELGGAALFLASDAGSYCTGTDLIVDGGYCCW